jgi:hypothetical protein
MEGHGLRLFKKRVLRKEEVKGERRKFINEGSFIICTLHRILLGPSSPGG